jgi:mono/diheme cytochrome c family protein
LARGEHLVRHVGHCTMCHGDDLGGGTVVDEFMIGRLNGPNLTTGEGGFLAEHSTDDLIRALRYGADPDGDKYLIMPSEVYYHMTDDDLAATVAYIQSAPPVDNEVDGTRVGPLLRSLILMGEVDLFEVPEPDDPAPRNALAESDDIVDQGHYLALIAGCVSCHGGDNLDGGEVLDLTAPPLHQNSAAANWDDEQFVETIRTGVTPGGHEIDEAMAWQYFAGMSDDELLAILEYMRSVES